MTIRNLKAQFTQRFPHLQIEIFTKAQYSREGSARKDLIDSNWLGWDRELEHVSESIFDPSQTVKSFEQRLEDEFGLHAQVFRLSGTIWLETGITYSWTLKEQEELAAEIAKSTKQ